VAEALLTSARVLQEIAAGRVRPVSLLLGPDDQLKAEIVARIVGTIDEDLRPFNVDKVFPADNREEARKQFWNVMQIVRTPPMMATRRVVVVAQTEKLLPIFKQGDDDAPAPEPPAGAKKGRRAPARGAGEAELDALAAYLGAPSPDCALVFVAGDKLNGNLKAAKLLLTRAAAVSCDPLEGSGRAAAWVRAAAESEGVRIEPAAAALLASLSGGDIGRLRAEFERALLFASGGAIITEAAVREVVSAPTTQDPWAMTNAIERRDAATALRELGMKIDAGEFPFMILGQIGWCARTKLGGARVAPAVEAVFRTDLALKTSRGDSRVLLERLVVELCG